MHEIVLNILVFLLFSRKSLELPKGGALDIPDLRQAVVKLAELYNLEARPYE